MKVSIVTVAYNSAKTIADTLRSVLQQTHPDIEYWVIDGASRDNNGSRSSMDVCTSFPNETAAFTMP